MIDQLNNKMTILTGEIKLLQSDKGTGLYIFAFHLFHYYYGFKDDFNRCVLFCLLKDKRVLFAILRYKMNSKVKLTPQ